MVALYGHATDELAAKREANIKKKEEERARKIEEIKAKKAEKSQERSSHKDLLDQKKAAEEQRRQEMLDNLLKVDQVEASFYAKEGDSETAADVAKFRVSKNSDFTKAKETYELVLQTLGTDIKEAVDGAKGSMTEAAAEAAKEAYKVLEDSESVLEEHGTQWAPQCAIVCVCSTVSKFLFMLNKSLLI